MKIEFLQDLEQTDPKIVVVAAEKEGRAEILLNDLERMWGDTVTAYDGDRVQILKQAEILRIYAEGAHVYCQTAEGSFLLRARLYEIEQMLDPQCFVRISKCEIVNIRRILRLDVSLVGTVGVVLEGNIKTYTSRRYMQKLKAAFGIERREKK